MKLFGKRLRWGMKLWFWAWLLALPLMLIGELTEMPWLWFGYGLLLLFVVMPVLYIIEGLSRRRGGEGIMWEDD